MKVSIVIPCYNEAEVIALTHARVKQAMSELASVEHELLYVDDGSTDATAEIMKVMSRSDESVKLVCLARNFGHEAAVTAGLTYASGDIVCLIDADLQDPPEALPPMIRKLEETRADVVYGVRRSREGDSAFKRVSAALFYRLIEWLSDGQVPLDTGNFRVMRRRVVEAFKRYDERARFVRGILSSLGFEQEPYLFDRAGRAAGTTKYHLKHMIRLALDAVFSFSDKPLRVALHLGGVSILVAIALLVYALVGRFSGAEAGWASLMTAVVFFGGVQLFSIGIVGSYIGKITLETKRRPIYIVKETVGVVDPD